MARVLIVGSPRGGELAESGHVVDEPHGLDPERLATVTPHLEDVSVVCWLFGESDSAALHGERLGSLLEYLVDTPVRGFVYERAAAYPQGEELVTRAHETFRLRTLIVSPADDLAAAVERVLAG